MSQEPARKGIKSYFQELSLEQLKLLFPFSTYLKGYAYYEEDRVESLEAVNFNELEAEVIGKNTYKVSLRLENGELLNECTCPISWNCKHVVAAMIFAQENVEELKEIKIGPQSNKFQGYLNTLSKKDLVELVLKYAPQNFRLEIENSYLEIDQAKKLFDKTAQKIKGLFDDHELLYEPSDFEGHLSGQFEKLKGIWYKFPRETEDLIIEIIEQIRRVMYDGMLYNHYYDDIFEGNDFLILIQNFVFGLPFQNKIEFVARFENAISDLDYDVFSNFRNEKEKIFSESEKPDLKEYWLKKIEEGDLNDAEGFYQFLGDLILPTEREMALENIYHLSSQLSLELVQLYEKQSKSEKAILLLEALLEANSDKRIDTKDLYKKLIELKNKNGLSIEKDAYTALSKHDSISLLEMIVSYLPEQRIEFEGILRSNNSNRFLQYLEKHNRIPEALQLVLKSNTLMERSIYNFYTRHFRSCAEEANIYFKDRINKELPYTGDSHYEIIKDALVYLKKIDKQKAAFILEMIRTEYKRRRNLMALLSDL